MNSTDTELSKFIYSMNLFFKKIILQTKLRSNNFIYSICKNCSNFKVFSDFVQNYSFFQFFCNPVISGHVQNPPAIKIHPVKFENRLPNEGKG